MRRPDAHMPVSIWSNIIDGEYADKIVEDTATHLRVNYFGQRTGLKDHLITPGAFFFYKNGTGKPYNYVGPIETVTELGKVNNISVYGLVIQKEAGEPKTFRIKNDACSSFGWPHINSFAVMSGIIQH